MQTALKDIVGFFGSLKSHRCVNVSIEQLANRYGVFECQSMSVMTLVCARNEWIKFGSPDLHVTTSMSWLVAIAQYSCDSSQIAHSAAVISCFELRWNLRKKLSSFVLSGSSFCKAKCRLQKQMYRIFTENQSKNKCDQMFTFQPEAPIVPNNQWTLQWLASHDVFSTKPHLV